MALTDNLVGYWKLEEASGTRADVLGNTSLSENGGTIGNAAGILGNGMSNNGSAKRLENTSVSGFNFGDSDFTLMFWAKKAAANDMVGGIRVDDGGGSPSYSLYVDGINISGTNKVVFTSYGNSGTETFRSTTSISDTSTFHMILATYTGSTNVMTVSVDNGTPDTTTAASGNEPITIIGSVRLMIGLGGGAFSNGVTDSVGIWSRVLTSGEMTTLYNGGAGLEYPWSGGGGGNKAIPPFFRSRRIYRRAY